MERILWSLAGYRDGKLHRPDSIGRGVSLLLLTGSIVAAISGSGIADTIDTRKANIATVNVGLEPQGLVVTPDGSAVYVANSGSNTVSVISSPANSVVATIPVGNVPMFVAVSPDGSTVFVSNNQDGTVSVISTKTKTVTNTISVGTAPLGLTVKPDGSQLWVCSAGAGINAGTVVIVDTGTLATTNSITIPVGQRPLQLVFNPAGTRAHVLNQGDMSAGGGKVRGYMTNIDATKERILGERTFMQDNIAPSGIAMALKDFEEVYISCLQSEKKVVKIGNRPTFVIQVFQFISGPHPNLKSYLTGIASGGGHFGARDLFIADPGENKLVRIRERWNYSPGDITSSHSVWLGEDIKPMYVALSPVLVGFHEEVHYVYTSNPSSGTVCVIDNLNIAD
jgi:YVTN family beta-propeller protein